MPRRTTLIGLIRRGLAVGSLVMLAFATPASAEWFGDLYLGGAFTGSRDLNIGRDTTLRNVNFDTSGVVGGRAGYWFNDPDFLAVALDVVHFRPDIARQVAFGGTALAAIDLKVTALSFQLMLRYPLLRDEHVPQGRLQPYVLLAPVLAITTATDTSNFGPLANQTQTSSQAGFTVGTGLLWQVHRHVGVFAEYRYLQFTPIFTFDPSTDVTFNVNTHLLAGGVSFRF